MKKPCSGILLAGGKNTRMNGENKAFLSVGGRTVIDRILSVYRLFFDDIVLVTKHPEQYYGLDLRIVTDVIRVQSPLAGIHAGLLHVENPFSLVLPCDLPFVGKGMVEVLLNHIDDRYSVIIPETQKGLEALFAVYAKSAIPDIERALSRGQLKIQSFYKPAKTYKISEKRLRQADPDLISFMNVNRPEEFTEALKIEKTYKEDRL